MYYVLSCTSMYVSTARYTSLKSFYVDMTKLPLPPPEGACLAVIDHSLAGM